MDILRQSRITALVISVCVVDSVTIAYDGSLMGTYSTPTTQPSRNAGPPSANTTHPAGSLNVMPSYTSYFHLTTPTIAVNTCATYIGAFLIAPFSGYLVDRWGRKLGIYIAGLLNIFGAILTAAAQNIGMFIAGRMMIGISCGIAQTAAGTDVGETTPPGLRALALGLYFSCWSVGSLLASGISYGSVALEPSTWAWRIPSLLQAVPGTCAMIVIFFLPESPRWLIYKDRHDEALNVLARINATPHSDPKVQVQYQEIADTIAFEKAEGRKLGFRECVRTAPNRKRLMLGLSIAPISMLSGSNIIT